MALTRQPSPTAATLLSPTLPSLIQGAGEMAERIRNHAWSDTPLGPLDTWPPELLAFVNLMLGSQDIMTLFWGPDRHMLYNDRYVTQLGERHPVLGLPLREVWPEVVAQVAPHLDRAFEQGVSSYLDESPLTVIEDGHNTVRFYVASFAPIWVRQNGSVRVCGVFQTATNNTEKVLAQRALEVSETQATLAQEEADRAHKKLQLAMEFAGQGSFFYEEATGLLSGDAVVQELFEQSSSSGLPEYWIAKVHPDDRQRVGEQFAAAIAGIRPYDIEHRVVRADGVRWLQARANRLSGPGEPVILIGISEDITARKDAERALQTTAERLNLAQATGHIASWDWDLETGGLVWNGSEWCWGRSGAELATADICFRFVHPEDLALLQRALEPALNGQAEYNCEFRVIWPDLSVHWVQAKGQSITARPDGPSTRIVGVNHDITERRLAESALLQNEKLAAVGRLASSIAHEINNPLESVTNLIFLAKSAPEVSAETQEFLEVADRELRRASSIVSQTLRFHKQATAPTRCSGQSLFQDILTVYQGRLINSHIKVDDRYREGAGVHCLEGDIRQVLSALIANAVDAMPQGGRLLLRSRASTHPKFGQRGMTLTIADTGFGMPPIVQRKAFEAFYSTKGIGGTGLGLWISKEIMDRHHGTMRMRSSQKEGRSGTVLTMFLPEHA